MSVSWLHDGSCWTPTVSKNHISSSHKVTGILYFLQTFSVLQQPAIQWISSVLLPPSLRNVAQSQDFGIAWSVPSNDLSSGSVSMVLCYLFYSTCLYVSITMASAPYLGYMLECMFDRTLLIYVVIACFLSLTYHQLFILFFAWALKTQKLNSFFRQFLIISLNPHLEMPMLNKLMSTGSFEIFSLQLTNQMLFYLLSLHW